jgi:hypothetical protein
VTAARHIAEPGDLSLTRAVALLAALFAIVFGSLAPFAAQAAARPGQTLILCSAEGPQSLSLDAFGKPMAGKAPATAKCAACLLTVPADLPTPPAPVKAAAPATRPASTFVAATPVVLPPARAPPRPPSTAPPHA